MPFGDLESLSPPPGALRSVMTGATTNSRFDPSKRKQTISFSRVATPSRLLPQACCCSGATPDFLFWWVTWLLLAVFQSGFACTTGPTGRVGLATGNFRRMVAFGRGFQLSAWTIYPSPISACPAAPSSSKISVSGNSPLRSMIRLSSPFSPSTFSSITSHRPLLSRLHSSRTPILGK